MTVTFPDAPRFSRHPWNGDFTVTTFKEQWSWGFRIQDPTGKTVRTGSGHHSQAYAWSEGTSQLHRICPAQPK